MRGNVLTGMVVAHCAARDTSGWLHRNQGTLLYWLCVMDFTQPRRQPE
jgi:hypothetical protein